MKVMVSTHFTQGQRKSDFCFVPEGELVRFSSQCDQGFVDDSCGCRRSMCGMKCQLATTTIKVVEMPGMTLQKLKTFLHASLVASGLYKAGDQDGLEAAEVEARELARLATVYPADTVLEKRGNRIQDRNL